MKPLSVQSALLGLLILFLVLVASGLTGSSLDRSIPVQSEVLNSDLKPLLGRSRAIRSDEYAVFTPLAIAQQQHLPRFPVINSQLGPNGQNMLVVGMSGVPVAHLSQWAKPATWGFYFLDLRRALAWQWWLPLFGALLAVWGAMVVLLPGQPWLGLATSATFVLSACVAAWSTWPAYTVMFVAGGFWVFAHLFRWSHWLALTLGGTALGLLLAGYVLVLYPPWQISVGYLFLMLSAALVVRDKLWLQVTVPRAFSLLLGLVCASLVLWAWWRDARPAVEALQSTVYPGQRTILQGGDGYWWYLLRGFLNHHTLYYDGPSVANASELASFLIYFPLVWLAIGLRRGTGISPLDVAFGAFTLLVLSFHFVGFAPWLAQWSLWGRVPTYRTDLALGLASLLWCAVYVGRRQAPDVSIGRAVVLALAWTVLAAWLVFATPLQVHPRPPVWVLCWMVVLLAVPAYLMLRRHVTAFGVAVLIFTGGMTIGFNPLVLAPTHISSVSVLTEKQSSQKEPVLALESQVHAMAMLAAGLPVSNGIFYYPQTLLWQKLDPKGQFAEVTNRYQHLIYGPDEKLATAYTLESPSPDVVLVRFHPERFDFALTGAVWVTAPVSINLNGNPSLVLVKDGVAQRLFRVKND